MLGFSERPQRQRLSLERFFTKPLDIEGSSDSQRRGLYQP